MHRPERLREFWAPLADPDERHLPSDRCKHPGGGGLLTAFLWRCVPVSTRMTVHLPSGSWATGAHPTNDVPIRRTPRSMMERFHYDNKIVNAFLMATIVFGIVGMLVGLTVAFQLVLPSWNIHEWLSFGRLRPLHTNAVIFAFVGNGIFAGVYTASSACSRRGCSATC